MSEQDNGADPERLRPAPSDRFAGKSHAYDLDSVLTELRAEAHPAKDGHRQMTIFHRAPVAHVVFDFEPGGKLKEHAAPGEVTIHVLEGRLWVEADGEDHDLRAGHVLILAPNVRHDVRATEASAMLLTIHMESQG